MRLSAKEASIIKHCVSEFDSAAKVYLFGSRTRDDLKGGDIDLLILSSQIGLDEIIKLKLKMYDGIGEQKIDIVTPDGTNETFIQLALSEGILL